MFALKTQDRQRRRLPIPFWVMSRRLISIWLTTASLLAAALVLSATVVGCGAGSDSPQSGLVPRSPDLTGAPSALRAIYANPAALLSGGEPAFSQRLRRLRLARVPVVVNKWASWCGPCRSEWPLFQSQVAKRGGEVAFIGVNSNDSNRAAREFLKELPTRYIHFSDPKLEIAATLKATLAFPTTTFFDDRGRLTHVKQGEYRSEADLATDIDRYTK